jgi:predicted metal-binding membrane protein
VTVLESVLRRERGVVAVGLATLTLLAWWYVWRGAGMGMSALDMTRVALFPHLQPEPMPGMTMPAVAWATVLAMWWIMMIAMMTPSAAPMILLYGRVLRHPPARAGAKAAYAPPLFLAAGYLAAWLGFSAVAATAQFALTRMSLIWSMDLSSRSAALSAVVLMSAGAYQLSPLKNACLRQCRTPVEFLTRHFRSGRTGALAMGARHGLWCVGCCWMLMALLFVGGVMNLVWIAVIAALVLVEKVAPGGVIVGRVAGVALIGWGVATLAV